MAGVKGSRKERAAETRRRMLQAAHDCFVEGGYAGTSMASIAARAGVAVQTLYFTFHTKPELLAQVFERAVFGPEDPAPPERQAWHSEAMKAPDVRTSLAIFCNGVAGIVARVAPLRRVFDGAAGEPGVAELWASGEQLRADGYRRFLLGLAERHPLRRGLGVDEALDVTLVLLGPVGHRGFVEDRSWSLDRWSAWVADTLMDQLFE